MFFITYGYVIDATENSFLLPGTALRVEDMRYWAKYQAVAVNAAQLWVREVPMTGMIWAAGQQIIRTFSEPPARIYHQSGIFVHIQHWMFVVDLTAGLKSPNYERRFKSQSSHPALAFWLFALTNGNIRSESWNILLNK